MVQNLETVIAWDTASPPMALLPTTKPVEMRLFYSGADSFSALKNNSTCHRSL
jgi:hypothetical protein